MFLWSGMSPYIGSCGLKEKEELRKKDVKESRSVMKRVNSTGDITEPWGTPALIE